MRFLVKTFVIISVLMDYGACNFQYDECAVDK